MSHYNAVPAFSPDVDILYLEEEQLYRAQVMSHGREFTIERGSHDELLLELEHQLGYEFELLMRYLDPDGLARGGFQSSLREGAYAPEVGVDMGSLLAAGLGVNAALCVIMPSPGLVKDALHVARRFGGSFSSRQKARGGSRVAHGFSKKRKFAAMIGGVTVVARSRRGLRKKVQQRKMHSIHIIMNSVRIQQTERLKNKGEALSRNAYKRRDKDLPEIDAHMYRNKFPGNKEDWRSRTGANRMRLIEKRDAALGLY